MPQTLHFYLSGFYAYKQVQHPGVQELMMTDIQNLKSFAAYLQKTELKFDLVSVVQEIEKQESFGNGIFRRDSYVENGDKSKW